MNMRCVTVATIQILSASAALAIPAVAQLARSVQQVPLRGPTLIAFFAITQGEIDSDSTGIVNAVDDFQWHLSRVITDFRGRKVNVVESYSDTLLLVAGPGKPRLFVARDSLRVGYIFWSPSKNLQVLWGVMNDVDLLCTAREYFGWKADSTTAVCN